MAVSELKKIVELENIELEGTLSNLEKQKARYVVNEKGAVKNVEIEGQQWNRANGIALFTVAEVFMLIMVVFAVFARQRQFRIFSIVFAAILFVLFVVTLVMSEVAQAKWNKNYRDLCLKIEETRTKINSNQKKLLALSEKNE